MLRRGFLQFLAASPAIGASAVSQAGNSIVGCLEPAPDVYDSAPSPASAYEQALSRARDRLERKQDARKYSVLHLPEHIASRKSWSNAFKVHVYTQERMEEVNPWSMTNDELAVFLANRGISIATGVKP